MKKYITFILLMVVCYPLCAQQKEARNILDRTASEFSKAGGVEAIFDVKVTENDRTVGRAQGKILVKGDKFFLETDEAITWFDGETQWTYLTGSEEVNISNPTEEELASINPYALLTMYKKGFDLKTNKTTDKPYLEVALAAQNKKSDIPNIILRIDKKTYEPILVNAQLQDGTWNEITITKYRTGLKHPDSLFVFDESKYPDAEIIDLR